MKEKRSPRTGKWGLMLIGALLLGSQAGCHFEGGWIGSVLAAEPAGPEDADDLDPLQIGIPPSGSPAESPATETPEGGAPVPAKLGPPGGGAPPPVSTTAPDPSPPPAASPDPGPVATKPPSEPSPPTKPPAAAKPEKPAPSKKERKVLALTFDDGPDGKYTPQVLDILKEYGVKATFFVVGTQVEKNPDTMKRILKEGHDIGNHSWSHADLTKLSGQALADQIDRTQKAVEKATGGYTPDLVRAPYGSVSKPLLDYVHEKELHHVLWTVDPRDWAGTSVSAMRANIRKHARPGGVILLHSFGGKKDALEHTIELLPIIIQDLKKAGYEFVTIDDMIDSQTANSSVIK
ncbi:polysaccharide deacetylase family protein [Cohnella candidum]|uniref:Polysaccharide deacetylase family protein n=1 Tax=Cohnella candidum TaxID=2674991 RepID=A0A3G3K4C8_9BACL|nr:polysaccharide deacetylase family protein [Cohnella candidum]AYQ75366.1 polysaccharide deacetylase family protein [Cohnella candidum]